MKIIDYRFILVIMAVVLFVGFCTGCTPYVGYTHLSQPNVADDGYDLICGGAETQKNHIRLDVAVCENLSNPHTDTYVKVDGRFLIW